MNKKIIMIAIVLGALFFCLLFAGFYFKEEAAPHFDTLDKLVSARYGKNYSYVSTPPMYLQNVFLLSNNDLVFQPNEKIEGKLTVEDGHYCLGFPFSCESDPDNVTVIFGAKGQSPDGWSKIIIKIDSSQNDARFSSPMFVPSQEYPDSNDKTDQD